MSILDNTTIYSTVISVIIAGMIVFFVKRSNYLTERILVKLSNETIFLVTILSMVFVIFTLRRNTSILQDTATYALELLLSFVFVVVCFITWNALDNLQAIRRWFKSEINIGLALNRNIFRHINKHISYFIHILHKKVVSNKIETSSSKTSATSLPIADQQVTNNDTLISKQESSSERSLIADKKDDANIQRESDTETTYTDQSKEIQELERALGADSSNESDT